MFTTGTRPCENDEVAWDECCLGFVPGNHNAGACPPVDKKDLILWTEMHRDNVPAHDTIDVYKVQGTFGETADELQIRDPRLEVEAGYFNKTVVEVNV
jgi:hypothetical protein